MNTYSREEILNERRIYSLYYYIKAFMKNYLALSIWGDGPGRPYDNIYFLMNVELSGNILRLSFIDGEECTIFDPKDIKVTECELSVRDASEVNWRFYEYGKPKSSDTIINISYKKLNDNEIQVLAIGSFKREEKILINGLAFHSYGKLDKNIIALD